MSSFDNVLQQSFLNMVGLTQIVNISGNTILLSTLTNTSTLTVSGPSIINNNITANANCNVLGNTLINNNVSINSNLYVSGFTIINNNLNVNSNLNLLQTGILNNNLAVSGNAIFNGPVSINSILNISGSAICNNILTNNIEGYILNIYGNTINIGNSISNVYINGTSLYDATTQIETIDKIITLNASPTTYLANDIGNNCGINIVGISGTGFIQTSTDATRFIIQTPISDTWNYILTQDTNYNINISGVSNLLGPTNINNLLTISGNTILNNNITVLGELYISGQTILQNNTTIMGILNVSNNAIFNNSLTTNVLNVSGNAIFNNTTTILSILNISGNTNITGTYTNLNILNVSNNAILYGSTSIINSLYVSGTGLLSNLTINSNLSVSGITVIANSLLNNSNLNISGTVILNSETSLNSSLTVSNTAIINSNLTALGNLNILGQITATLPSYSSNTEAKNNGVPVWGLYINGAILMVRLNDVPPTITLNGSSNISINYGSAYTELGINVTSPLYTNLYGYIYSIGSGTTNILSNNILVSGTSLLITQTSSLTAGSYLVSYNATDPDGLIGYTTRNLTVTPPPSPPMPIFIFSGGNITSNYWCLTNKNIGQPWVGLDINRTVFNPTLYNWGLGLSISFQINFSQFIYGLFTFRGSGSGSNRGLYHLRNQDATYIGIDPNAIGFNTDLTGNNSLLFSFPNDGSFTIWKNGTISYQGSTSCNVFPTTPTGPDVYIGISQIASNYLLTGTITNIKIWNQPMVWTSDLFN